MSREKKPRPSVGAPGRAVETGSASRADTTSKPQFTPNGPGGQRKVADLLSDGRENAIPRRERREGVPILADNDIPATEYERAACVRSMRHRADEIRKTAEAIDRAGV